MALHHNLPPFFAVMDPASPLPSRYYVFMTYELDQSVIVVNNMKFSKPFIVWVGQTDETRPHTTKLRYYGLETEIMFWNTGIDIMSDENKLIPVLDFERDLFLPSPASNPSPVYVTPDTITSKNQNQTMIRERRTQMMDIIRNLYNDVRMTPPPPPAIQRIHPDLPKFTLPSHAAATFVRALIQENKSCSITTNSFNEIATVGITPCFHCFDCEALERWLAVHKTCPECRSSVSNLVKYTR